VVLRGVDLRTAALLRRTGLERVLVPDPTRAVA
jgi:hypothetical protein